MGSKTNAHLSLLTNKPETNYFRSDVIRYDQRLKYAPRYFGVLHSEDGFNLFFRVYGLLETPGSELVTMSVYNTNNHDEYEFSVEEYYIPNAEFKKLKDDEKAEMVFDSLEDWGGPKKLFLAIQEMLKEKKSA